MVFNKKYGTYNALKYVFSFNALNNYSKCNNFFSMLYLYFSKLCTIKFSLILEFNIFSLF
jgi:hypothetical protein